MEMETFHGVTQHFHFTHSHMCVEGNIVGRNKKANSAGNVPTNVFTISLQKYYNSCANKHLVFSFFHCDC
jgi:hypothetical protein